MALQKFCFRRIMIKKISILRSDFIGVYARVWEDVAFLPIGIEQKEETEIATGLGVKTFEVQIDSSNLIGTLLSMNSRGVVIGFTGIDFQLPEGMEREVTFLKDKLNAVGNNIITNDKVAMVHKGYTASSIKRIADALDVEVIKGTIGGIKTVGSAAVLTPKGMLVTSEATEEELSELRGIFKVPVEPGTANFGNPYVGSSIIANSKGVFIGRETTPIEIGRIDDVLS